MLFLTIKGNYKQYTIYYKLSIWYNEESETNDRNSFKFSYVHQKFIEYLI